MSHCSSIKITLKAAATLDGKIATSTGKSKWITGDAARQKGHQLRNEHDAILVGINTVIADDPELTVRGIEGGRSPIRVVLDSNARIPVGSKLLKNDGVKVIIIIGSQSETNHLPSSSNLILMKAPTPVPEISWTLLELEKLEIKSLLVEGGSRIHASFIKSKCVNELALFLAPKIIGGNNALSWCGELGVDEVDDAPQLEIKEITALGKDWFISAKFR